MTKSTYTKEEFWAELEALGEEEVRVRIVTKKYGDVGDKLALAKEWLESQERRRSDASHAEQIHIARSAKNAAWIAAIAAVIAVGVAIFTIAFSKH
ncbi:MAG: hypothetical protein U1E36_06010 [Rickettsiales bacterium]